MHIFSSKTTLGSYRPFKAVAISIILALVIYISLAFYLDLNQFSSLLQAIELKIWIVLVSLTFISSCVRFIRWGSYLTCYDARLPVATSFLIYFSGFALIATPAAVGENIRSIFASRYQLSFSDCLALFISERYTDIAAILLIVCFVATSEGHLHIAWGSAITLSSFVIILRSPLLKSLFRTVQS